MATVSKNPRVGSALLPEMDAAKKRLQQQRVGTTSPQPIAPAQPRVGRIPATALTPAETASFQRQSPNFPGAKPSIAQGLGAPAPAPARPAPTFGAMRPSALTPAEAASFQRQNPNFQTANPTAPTVQNAMNRTNMGAQAARPAAAAPTIPVQQRVGAAVKPAGTAISPRVARFGAAPVATAGPGVIPGLQKTAASARGGTGFLPATAIASAVDSMGRDTSDYRSRLGMAPAGGVAGDVAARTVGVVSDLGSSILDIGSGVVNAVRGAGGAAPIQSFSSMLQQQDNPEAMARARADAATQAGQPAPAAPAANPFAGVTSSVASTAQTPEQKAAAIAANGGIVPPGMRNGSPDEVIGTFNGRQITRGQSDQMSGQGQFAGQASQPPSIGTDLPAPRMGNANFGAGNVGGGSEERAADLLDGNSAAGKLYQQLLADKTPTGKRMAGQFADTYLNGGATERGQDVSANGDAMSANASVTNTNTSAASSAASSRFANRSKGELMTGEDGTVSSILDGLVSPVLGPDGKPFKAVGKASGTSQLDTTAKIDEITKGRMPPPDSFATAEEFEAAFAARKTALLKELGLITDEKAK